MSSLRALILLVLLAAPSSAQTQDVKTTPDRGFLPGASYSASDIETISIENGSLSLRVPLASMPPGRAGMSGGINLVYNSQLYDILFDYSEEDPVEGTPVLTSNLRVSEDSGGWQYAMQVTLLEEQRQLPALPGGGTECLQTQQETYKTHKLKLGLPDGSLHILHLRGYDDFGDDGFYEYDQDGQPTACASALNRQPLTNQDLVYFTTDGSFIKVVFHQGTSPREWTVYFPDGRTVRQELVPEAVQQICDRNGNCLFVKGITLNGNPATEIRDDLNRVITIENKPTSQDEIVATGFDGAQLKWTVHWINVTPASFRYLCTDIGLYCNTFTPGSHRVVQKIDVPSNSPSQLSYEFQYQNNDGHGELTQMTLPSGAVVDYDYEKHGKLVDSEHTRTDPILENRVSQKDLNYQENHDGVPDNRTDTWQYTSTTVQNPDGEVTTYTGFAAGVPSNPRSGRVFKVQRPNGDIIERYWEENTPQDVTTGNVFVRAEYRTIADNLESPSKTTMTVFDYDKNGNLLRTEEYGWFSPSLIPRGALGEPNGIASVGDPVRTTVNTYYAFTGVASDTTSDFPDAYWNLSSPPLRNAVNETRVHEGDATGTVKAKTVFTYDDPDTTGNVTQETRGVGSDAVTTLTDYVDTNSGNVETITNPNGDVTKFTYGSMCGSSDLYPSQREDAFGSPVARTFTLAYDCDTGLTTRETDADNSVITDFDYDDLSRQIEVHEAVGKGGDVERKTITSYDDQNRLVRVLSAANPSGSGTLATVTHFDELGRSVLSRTTDCPPGGSCEVPALNPSDTNGVKVQTRLRVVTDDPTTPEAGDGVSFRLVSNPFRASTSAEAGPGSGDEETMGWTRTKIDEIGRIVEIETFRGAALPAPWGSNSDTDGVIATDYNADQTTVTDQVGAARRGTVDALGRLQEVVEDPGGALNYTTTYGYDILDNLQTVCQDYDGMDCGQTRTFVYNSLSQRESATNIENGTIAYTYDANGNLDTKTDHRGTVTDNDYDELNRLTSTTYVLNGGATSTPSARFCYDGETWDGSSCTGAHVAPNIGQLTQVYTDLSDTVFTYDELGRVVSSQQTTEAADATDYSYSFAYEYNLASGLTKQTNPSGRILTYGYDDGARIDDVHGLFDGATTSYGSAFAYTAHGAVQQVKRGTATWEYAAFNSRLQPTDLRLGTSAEASDIWRGQFSYDAPGPGGNNGNVYSQTLDVPGLPATLVQDYTYDEINRLGSVTETGGAANWSRTYGYDPYGNRWVSNATGHSLHSSTPASANDFSTATNRSQKNAAVFDDSGNLLSESLLGSMAYDANNRQTSFTDPISSGVTTYDYDGLGTRVRKTTPTATTLYVYNAFGRLAAEYATVPTTGPLGTQYRMADHLGSTRVITDASGGIVSRRDFFPFGEEIPDTLGGRDVVTGYNQPGGYRQQFTGQERDEESGLDYFLARYYSGPLGRFASADGPFLDQFPVDPQSWLLYGYARNNPLRYIDDTGQGKLTAIAKKGLRRVTRASAIRNARRRGVSRAWAEERALVMAKKPGTRQKGGWTAPQRAELIATGRVKGFEGHHINSVAAGLDDLSLEEAIQLAENPNNIVFLTRDEHFMEHMFNWANRTFGDFLDRSSLVIVPYLARLDREEKRLLRDCSICSSPDAWHYYFNPFNDLADPAVFLNALFPDPPVVEWERESVEKKTPDVNSEVVCYGEDCLEEQ